MKGKIIKLLRDFETRSGFINKYVDFDHTYQCDYSIEEYVDFPNYRTVITGFNEIYVVTNENGLIVPFSSNSIRAELKRMETEGLIMIGVQEGRKYATTDDVSAPDFDEGTNFTSESIILTTKGKNRWDYFIYKATEENPISTLISLFALVISVVALL